MTATRYTIRARRTIGDDLRTIRTNAHHRTLAAALRVAESLTVAEWDVIDSRTYGGIVAMSSDGGLY